MAHHYFVETFFLLSQVLMALLVYLIPGIVKKYIKMSNRLLLSSVVALDYQFLSLEF
jgi:hypothetical protein